MPTILRLSTFLLTVLLCLPRLGNATAVGYTPGSFKINNTGAATYTIPIAVPPGTAGMQPSLSLVYNSQSGNGLLGVGFALQRLSAITRCPQTHATDGNTGGIDLTYNDRFCLDGQRLVLIGDTYGYPGSEYRTERDTLTKIVAYGPATGNGPSYFIAQTKSGQTNSRPTELHQDQSVAWSVIKNNSVCSVLVGIGWSGLVQTMVEAAGIEPAYEAF